jgi:hypothetical protein
MNVGPNPWTGGDLHFGDLDMVRVHTQDSVFAAHRTPRSDRGNAPFLEEGGLIRGTADERLLGVCRPQENVKKGRNNVVKYYATRSVFRHAQLPPQRR